MTSYESIGTSRVPAQPPRLLSGGSSNLINQKLPYFKLGPGSSRESTSEVLTASPNAIYQSYTFCRCRRRICTCISRSAERQLELLRIQPHPTCQVLRTKNRMGSPS